MLDHLAVFTKGGIVLWFKQWAPLKGSPINVLIRAVMLEVWSFGRILDIGKLIFLQEHGGQDTFSVGSYTMKWAMANEFDLIFVAVYQRILTGLVFVDELLQKVKMKFCGLYKDDPYPDSRKFRAFTSKFDRLYQRMEARAIQERKAPRVQRTFAETAKGQALLLQQKHGSKKGAGVSSVQKHDKATPGNTEGGESNEDADKNTLEPEEGTSGDGEHKVSGATPGGEVGQKTLQMGMGRGVTFGRRKAIRRSSSSQLRPSSSTASIKEAPAGKKPAKKGRKWDEKEEVNASLYDRGPKASKTNTAGRVGPMAEKLEFRLTDSEESSTEEEQATSAGSSGKNTGIWSFFRNFGDKTLTDEDLQPVMLKFMEHLKTKNVASDIAEQLCSSVASGLVGRKIGTFQGITQAAKQSLEAALTRILTPAKNVDILRDVQNLRRNKATWRPYSIVFMGVNGVGKSTNLSKVASWLQENGVGVLIAACDTFRSGAVDQLQVHSERLGIPLIERGYDKDPTRVALDALAVARDSMKDVVLIDTAGRMQGNEPLMRAIAKLVNTVRPDLVLFVGDALVGNDAVDQLTRFNQSLADMSGSSSPHLVDGIILTKVDTIDDKVGAAISMVYTTGVPIVFVGTGQHYTDLKRLNVSTVVRTLLK